MADREKPQHCAWNENSVWQLFALQAAAKRRLDRIRVKECAYRAMANCQRTRRSHQGTLMHRATPSGRVFPFHSGRIVAIQSDLLARSRSSNRGHRNETCAPTNSNTSRWQASPADCRDHRAGAGSSRQLRTTHLLAAAANAAHDLAGGRDQVAEQVAISHSTSAGFRSNRATQFRRLRCEPQFARYS